MKLKKKLNVETFMMQVWICKKRRWTREARMPSLCSPTNSKKPITPCRFVRTKMYAVDYLDLGFRV